MTEEKPVLIRVVRKLGVFKVGEEQGTLSSFMFHLVSPGMRVREFPVMVAWDAHPDSLEVLPLGSIKVIGSPDQRLTVLMNSRLIRRFRVNPEKLERVRKTFEDALKGVAPDPKSAGLPNDEGTES